MDNLLALRFDVFLNFLSAVGALILSVYVFYKIKSYKPLSRTGVCFIGLALFCLSASYFLKILSVIVLGKGNEYYFVSIFSSLLGGVVLVSLLATGLYALLGKVVKLLKTEKSLQDICYIYEGFGQKQENEIELKKLEISYKDDEISKGEEKRRGLISKIEKEMKNPVYTLLGLSDILLETDLDDNQISCVEAMKSSAQSLKYKVDSLVDLELAGAPHAALTVVSLRSVLKKFEIGFNGDVSSCDFSFHINEDVPQLVKMNQEGVGKVLKSLAEGIVLESNEQSSISLSVSLDRLNQDEALICFSVKDVNGNVNKSDLHRLQSMFSDMDNYFDIREQSARNRDVRFVFAKNIVQSMDGWCGVSLSSKNIGEFWFRLPLMIVRDGEQDEGERVLDYDTFKAKVDSSVKKSISDIKVLVVDDQAVNILVVRKHLEKIGVPASHIYGAENGKKALEMVKNSKFDLVLMDCQMPVMDGFMTTKLIREKEGQRGARSIPIVALTANVMGGVKDECLSVGMDDYMSKPSSVDVLQSMISKWVLPEN